MQHLCKFHPKAAYSGFPKSIHTCQTQVGFFALLRINHMLHRLCEPPSIPLSFSLAAVLPRRRTYQFSYGTIGVRTSHTQCASFTAWTTRVSNPVRYPRFRVSASGQVQSPAFASGVPSDIYAFHRSTTCSSDLYLPQECRFALPFPG